MSTYESEFLNTYNNVEKIDKSLASYSKKLVSGLFEFYLIKFIHKNKEEDLKILGAIYKYCSNKIVLDRISWCNDISREIEVCNYLGIKGVPIRKDWLLEIAKEEIDLENKPVTKYILRMGFDKFI